jgi:membrane-bound metal-dependent hydrolase YbcI (DUF457 family)
MMGRSHALSGAAVGIGVAAYLVHMPVPEACAGVAVCTGAALLPDIDHPRSTVSNSFGPITRAFCWIMSALTGGHRRGTHSILGIAVLGVLAQTAVTYRTGFMAQVFLCGVMVLTFAGPIRLLGIPGWLDDLAPIPVVIWIVSFTHVPLGIVPPALVLGCLVHVLGDVVTLQGCPILWPVDQRNFKLGLFRTNGPFERWVMVPVFVVGIIAELVGTVLPKV